jgi:hypothetical protein
MTHFSPVARPKLQLPRCSKAPFGPVIGFAKVRDAKSRHFTQLIAEPSLSDCSGDVQILESEKAGSPGPFLTSRTTSSTCRFLFARRLP